MTIIIVPNSLLQLAYIYIYVSDDTCLDEYKNSPSPAIESNHQLKTEREYEIS